jgi:WD40 repeat protein
MEGRTNIQDLPFELLLKIFAYLSSKELDTIALTCSLFYGLAFDHTLRQYSPLDYTKRREHKDKNDIVPIKPGHIIPMTNKSIIIVEEFRYEISLIELDKQPSVTTIYNDDRDSYAVAVNAYTKVSKQLFAYILGFDFTHEERDYRLIYLWDTELKKCVKEWKVPNSQSYFDNLLVMNNTNLIQSCGNQINFWDLNDLSKDAPIKTITLADHQIDIQRLFINQQNQFVIIDDRQHIHLYDENGQALKRIDGISAKPSAWQLLSNDKLFGVCDNDSKFCVIDLETGDIQKQGPTFTQPLLGPIEYFMGGNIQLIAHTPLIAMSYNRQNTLLHGSGVTLWDTNTMTCISVLREYLQDYAIMPDNRIVTIQNRQSFKREECNLHIWDFEPLTLQSKKQQEQANEKTVTSALLQIQPTSEHPENQSKEKPSKKKSSLRSAVSFFTHKGSSQLCQLTQKAVHLTQKVLPKKPSSGNT